MFTVLAAHIDYSFAVLFLSLSNSSIKFIAEGRAVVTTVFTALTSSKIKSRESEMS